MKPGHLPMTGPSDSPDHTLRRFVPVRNLEHGPFCGERVDCPRGHDLGPYHPAERQVRRDGVYVLCHICRGRWSEEAA